MPKGKSKRTRWTQESFIKKCKEVHGDKYDYSRTVYEGTQKKLKVVCPKHGEFLVYPNSHMKGHDCQLCGWDKVGDSLRGSLEKFREKAENKYSEFDYDYSQVEYKTARTKVKIICPDHGKFYRTPDEFLGKKAQNCPDCLHPDHANRQEVRKEKFVQKCEKIHGDKYDYSQVFYKGNTVPITIECKKHGVFTATPVAHIKASGGCSGCRKDNRHKRLKSVKDEFVSQSQKIHNGKYTYENVDYFNKNTKVMVTCPEHGDFLQEPTKHLLGRGCPRCADKIRYIYQYHCHKQNDMYYTDARSNIYIMRFTMPNNGDTFIKIGLSVNVDERRYKLQLSSGADVEILYQMENRADHLRLCEHSTFELFKDYEYFPVEKFDGHSECFVEELYDDLVDYIEKYMYDAALFEANLPNPSDFDIDRLQKESA